jgi:hypothetical protein
MPKKNNHHLPAVTRVVVQSGLLVPDVAASRCKPDEIMALAVVNTDATDYTIRLTAFLNKATGGTVTQANLFKAASASHAIPKTTVTVIERTIKAAGNWGTNSGQFPFTTYEFTVELWDAANTRKLDDLDPDFDITP